MIKAIKLVNLLILFSFIIGCTPYKKSIYIPKGVFEEKILLRSEPTEAMIYINGREVGKTPFKTSLFYAEDMLVNIKAVPIYPNQYTQNIFVRVPPIPKTMTIYMNEKPKFVFEIEEEDIQPPAKRPPVVITEYDTLYVDRISYYTTPIIYFDFDKDTLKEESFPSLDQLVVTIMNNPGINVCIIGHTDNVGSAKYNKNLSEKRAKSVYQYLIDKGVDQNILNYRGEGQENPKVPNDSEENRQLNRRVEFVVSKNDEHKETMDDEVVKPVEVVTPQTETQAVEPEQKIEVVSEEEVLADEEVAEEIEIIEEKEVEPVQADNFRFLSEEEVQEVYMQSHQAKAPFFTDPEVKIISNKIIRIAKEYGIQSKMQILLTNQNNHVNVSAIYFEDASQNESFGKSVKRRI